MAQSKHIHDIIARLKGFKKAEKGVKGLSSTMKRFAVGLVSVTAAYKAFGVAVESIKMAGKLEGVENAFKSMSREGGFTIGLFSKLEKALDGTADKMTIMTQANNAMLLGIADSDEQMAEMFDTAQRLAEAVGQDATFGIESLVTGLGRQSKLMLDNLGIIVDTNLAYEKYAKELKKTVSQLTDAERKQGFVNEAMRQGKELVDLMGDESDTTARQLDRFTTSITDFKVAIGQALIDSGVLGQLTTFTNVLVKMAKEYSNTEKTAAELADVTGDGAKAFNIYTKDIEDSQVFVNALTIAIDSLKNMVATGKKDVLGFSEALQHFPKEVIAQIDAITGSTLSVVQAHKDLFHVREKERERIKQDKKDRDYLLDRQIEQNVETQLQIDLHNALILARQVSINQLENKLIPKELEYARIMGEQIDHGFVLSDSYQQWVDQKKPYLQQMEDSISIGQSVASGDITMAQAAKRAARIVISEEMKILVARMMRQHSLDFAFLPFPLDLAAIAAASSAVTTMFEQQISRIGAQTGFEGVVSEPTQFTVGEGGASEYVSVSPLEGVNNAGGGQGITVNITGNVMSDTFVEEELAEKIQEAVRKGISFGIS